MTVAGKLPKGATGVPVRPNRSEGGGTYEITAGPNEAPESTLVKVTVLPAATGPAVGFQTRVGVGRSATPIQGGCARTAGSKGRSKVITHCFIEIEAVADTGSGGGSDDNARVTKGGRQSAVCPRHDDPKKGSLVSQQRECTDSGER